MKIHPPKAIVDANNPFEHALFGRKEFAESLTGLLKNVSESLVIFVNAPWGEGKTTFAKMWQAELQRQNCDAIYFDAYAVDHFDDPFVAFSGEILALVEKSLKEKGLNERREFKKSVIEVSKRFAGLAVKVGLRAATMGALDETHIEELKTIGTEAATGVSEIGADLIEKKIEHYSEEKDALTIFKKSLTKLAAVVRKEQGFPLTIIVDELDRCRPDFALGLLERIKHLFDVEGVAFVLLVNRDQIESYVRTVYGKDVEARAYLLKFANIFVDLPNQHDASNYQYVKGRPHYCQMLFGHFEFGRWANGQSFLVRSIISHVSHFDLTLREIEKVFAIMALYYSSMPAQQFTNEYLIAMLSVLKVKRPSLYHQISLGRVSADMFFKETRLDQIKKDSDREMNWPWLLDMLNFCLLSDVEYGNLLKSKAQSENFEERMVHVRNWLLQSSMNRQEALPFLCRRLDRFSVQPQ